MSRSIRSRVLFFGFLALLGGRPLRASDDPPIVSSGLDVSTSGPQIRYSSLDAYLDAMVPAVLATVQGKIGIAVGTVLNGQVGRFYYGETGEGGGKTPDGYTVFLTASLSKTFTAMLLALDVQSNLVQLDDPIQKYLPEGIQAPLFNGDSGHPITLEHLATHTSGLPLMPTFDSYAGPVGVEKLFESLNTAQLVSAPGSKYLYSNYGYALLGHLLARAAGKDWRTLNWDNIAVPLAMDDTKVESQLSAEERMRKAPGQNVVVDNWTFFPAENPAGGLYSTLNDMSKYLVYAMGLLGSPLDSLLPSLFQARHSAGSIGQIALAWNLSDLPGTGERVIWKDGGLLGYESYIGFVPEKGVGVVLLLNSQGVDLDSLAQKILAFLLTNPAQTRTPIPLPRVDLDPLPQLPRGPAPL